MVVWARRVAVGEVARFWICLEGRAQPIGFADRPDVRSERWSQGGLHRAGCEHVKICLSATHWSLPEMCCCKHFTQKKTETERSSPWCNIPLILSGRGDFDLDIWPWAWGSPQYLEPCAILLSDHSYSEESMVCHQEISLKGLSLPCRYCKDLCERGNLFPWQHSLLHLSSLWRHFSGLALLQPILHIRATVTIPECFTPSQVSPAPSFLHSFAAT